MYMNKTAIQEQDFIIRFLFNYIGINTVHTSIHIDILRMSMKYRDENEIRSLFNWLCSYTDQ